MPAIFGRLCSFIAGMAHSYGVIMFSYGNNKAVMFIEKSK